MDMRRLRAGRPLVSVLALLALLVPRPAPAAPGSIRTFAGGVGDESLSTVGRLYAPAGAAADTAGNLYIADTGNHRVRKVDLRGVITTVAGTGVAGFSGDNGLATAAKLRGPSGLALDPAGNVYVADTGNNRIRRISADGVITTFAGTGPASFSGDKELAIRARLNRPSGVALDGLGNVYIADTGNNRIRLVSASGTITTFAGDGRPGFTGDRDLASVARLNAPTALVTAIATSSSGGVPAVETGATKDQPGVLVYIADTGNNRIRRVDTTGKILTIAGSGVRGFAGDGGAPLRSRLNAPRGLALDSAGRLLVADTGNHRVRRIDAAAITTLAGTGTAGFSGDGSRATGARLSSPVGLAQSRNGLFVADSGNHRVRGVTEAGDIITVAGSSAHPVTGDGGQAVAASLLAPRAVLPAPDGSVYIADTLGNRVRRVAPNGVMTTIAGTGVAGFLGDGKAARLARLNQPNGLALDRSGNLYISDSLNHRIRRVSRGIITTIAGTGVPGYAGDGKAARYARLLVPTGLATDTAGNIFLADTGNNRIRKINARGVITTVAGTGAKGFSGEGRHALAAALSLPFGVAVDADGNVFVADTFNNRIRVIGTTGIITTIAGTKARGFIGDGGPATMAQLNTPWGVALDRGNVYIADTGNKRIRVVTPDGVIATIAGNGSTTPTPDLVPALAATFSTPVSLAVVPGGLLLADAGDHRIRYLESTPVA